MPIDDSSTLLAGASAPTTENTIAGDTASATPQAQAGQAAPAAEWLADRDGNFAESWRQALPESIRDAKSLDNMRSVQALATSYVNAQRMIGANKMVVPTEKSSAEEWGAVYDALGRPKEASGYETPEGFSFVDEAQRDAVFKAFHEAGLSGRQAGDMMRLYGSVMDQIGQNFDQQRQKGEAELRREWGLSYDANLQSANRALVQLGLADSLRGNPCLNDPGFIKAMASAGMSMGETKIGNSPAGPASAASRLEAILNDRTDAYYDATNPNHARRVEEVNRLLAMNSR